MKAWDACGNRLLVIVEPADDEALRASSHVARHCFEGGERIYDGVAWFAPRDGFHRTAFFNPDGSLERLCGNSLLVAAAIFGSSSSSSVRPFDHPSVDVRASDGRLEARSAVPFEHIVRTVSRAGPVFDTGSPHLVVESDDVRRIEIAEMARPLMESLDVNVTLYAHRDGVAMVRTFERGVNAETLSCGTGALAVALAIERPIEVRYPGGSYEAHAERTAGEVTWTFSTRAERVRQL